MIEEDLFYKERRYFPYKKRKTPIKGELKNRKVIRRKEKVEEAEGEATAASKMKVVEEALGFSPCLSTRKACFVVKK